jgi:hypothetical protein
VTLTESQPAASARRARLGSRLLVIALVVAVGGVSFAAGRLTASPLGSSFASSMLGGSPFGGFGGGRTGSGSPFGSGSGGGLFGGTLGGGFMAGFALRGEVTEVNDESITVRLSIGTTMKIATDGATRYHTRQDATRAAIEAGTDVLIQLGSRSSGAALAPGGSGSMLGTASEVTIVAP